MAGTRIRRYIGPLIAILIIVSVGVGAVYAAIPNPVDGKYYACRVKKTGVVRVINYPKVKTCPKGQKLISWNQTGPQGVQGLQGLQGPPGPSGITKIHITHVTTDPPIMVGAYDFQFGTVDCPAGKVIGGGFSAPAGLGEIGVVPYQSFAADADTWWVAVRNPTGEASPFWVWAVCMTTEPGSVVAKVSPAAKRAIKIAKARRG